MTPLREAFIVGAGRCGSTLLSDVCGLNPHYLSLSELFTALGEERLLGGVCSGHEVWSQFSTPTPDATDLIALSRGRPREILVTDEVARVFGGAVPPVLITTLFHLSREPLELFEQLGDYLCKQPAQPTARLLSSLFEWLAQRSGARAWIERSGGSLRYLELLAAGWPSANIVHLYRDPVACAHSMSQHAYFRTRLVRHVRRTELSVSDCVRETLPIAKFGQYWSAVVLRSVGLLRTLAPQRVLHVRIEHVNENPTYELERLGAFLCPDSATRAWVDDATALVQSRIPAPAPIEPADRKQLERACLPGVRALRNLGLSV